MNHADRPEYMILSHTQADHTLVGRHYADDVITASNYAGRSRTYGWTARVYQMDAQGAYRAITVS